MAPFSEYHRFDALDLATMVREGRVTPVQLVESAIERIERLNPAINAVVQPMYEQAYDLARSELPPGPMRGVPFLLKDLVATYAGAPFRCGSRFLNDYVADRDSELVTRYKKAGLITLGKTNTPEFGLTPFTEPKLFGPVRNPWDSTRTAGGSSGGSAAAVAARMVPLAGGGDGGGSIRIPASCCGVFGLKPTRGRTPTGPLFGEMWEGCVVEHVLTRSVRDSAALLDVISGPDVGAPYYPPPPDRPFLTEVSAPPGSLRIAYTAEPFLGHEVHPDCVNALHDTVALLRDLGHTVSEASPSIDGPAFARSFLTMLCGELWADLRDAERAVGRKATMADFEPTTWALGLMGEALSAGAFAQAVRSMQRAARVVGGLFELYDILLTPTLASPPVLTGSLQPKPSDLFVLELLGGLHAAWALKAMGVLETSAATVFDFVPYTAVFNVTGQPAMSVPLYHNPAGLPIGMHFVGRYADEATLFRLAGQLESALPWRDRMPELAQ